MILFCPVGSATIVVCLAVCQYILEACESRADRSRCSRLTWFQTGNLAQTTMADYGDFRRCNLFVTMDLFKINEGCMRQNR